jgi:hypothetical protein
MSLRSHADGYSWEVQQLRKTFEHLTKKNTNKVYFRAQQETNILESWLKVPGKL